MKPESLTRLMELRQSNRESADRGAFMRTRFEALKGRHELGTAPRAVSAFNLFQTPEHVAARMAELVKAHSSEGRRVLEPSAGLGRIYKALRLVFSDSARVVMVEESAECCQELYRITGDNTGDRLFQRDFLEMTAHEMGGTFDAVCMNPPFKMGADILHILHALAMVSTGGYLVSLCYNGARQNAKLKPICDAWEVLPAGTFQAEGTHADVVLLTITKGRE